MSCNRYNILEMHCYSALRAVCVYYSRHLTITNNIPAHALSCLIVNIKNLSPIFACNICTELQKIDGLQRENKQLKKSVYDLSVRYDILAAEKSGASARGTPRPFDLDLIFANNNTSEADTEIGLLDEPITTTRLDVKGTSAFCSVECFLLLLLSPF